jgi:hypothetical protein
MPLYTLTLISLLKGACVAWGYEDAFRVLGDDVVIADPGLANWFTSFLPRLGVEISTSKGIVSDRVAEFIGATITADDYVFPGKWKSPNNRNIFQLVKHFGRPLSWKSGAKGDAFQRACGMALIKEQCYSCNDRMTGGLITPLSVPIDGERVARIRRLSEEYGVDPSKVDVYYSEYTRTRVISTLRSLAGQFSSGKAMVKGTYIDRLYRRYLWDSSLEIGDTCFERDSFYSIDLLLDCLQRVIEYAVSPRVAQAFKSWTKAKGDNRDSKLANKLHLCGEWLAEWSGGAESFNETAGYFVFEGFASILDQLYGHLSVEYEPNKWRRQQARYERFVQFAMHAPYK